MLARLDALCSGVALPVCSNSADQIQLLFTTGAKKGNSRSGRSAKKESRKADNRNETGGANRVEIELS